MRDEEKRRVTRCSTALEGEGRKDRANGEQQPRTADDMVSLNEQATTGTEKTFNKWGPRVIVVGERERMQNDLGVR
jgi:hypothetical protein